jgi:hypothetical protein
MLTILDQDRYITLLESIGGIVDILQALNYTITVCAVLIMVCIIKTRP